MENQNSNPSTAKPTSTRVTQLVLQIQDARATERLAIEELHKSSLWVFEVRAPYEPKSTRIATTRKNALEHANAYPSRYQWLSVWRPGDRKEYRYGRFNTNRWIET